MRTRGWWIAGVKINEGIYIIEINMEIGRERLDR